MSKFYQDQQDMQRFLEIVEQKDKKSTCKVFFNIARDNEPRRLVYSGKTVLASNLLVDSFSGSYRDRVSFVLC